MIGMGVRDDRVFDGLPGVDVEIAAGAIQSRLAHFEEWSAQAQPAFGFSGSGVVRDLEAANILKPRDRTSRPEDNFATSLRMTSGASGMAHNQKGL